MTKEELQIKVGKLETSNTIYKADDLLSRTELSGLLGGRWKTDKYSNDKTLIPYSWMEIAFEIGKLKTFKRNVDLGDKVNNLEDNLSRIENNVGEDIIKIDNRLNNIKK